MNLSNAVISVLLFSLSEDVPAPTRYFLMAFLHRYGVAKPVGAKVKALAQELNVSDKVAGQAIRQLSQRGILDRRSTSKELGKKPREYRLTNSCAADLASYRGPSNVGHEQLIKVLLSSPVLRGSVHSWRRTERLGGIGPPDSENLTTANRMVLLVLLAEADACGVIWHRSSAWIARTSGMPVQRARRNLAKLWRLGYLRNIVPGVSGKEMLGKCPSIYYLNLAHPAFDEKWGGRGFVMELHGARDGLESEVRQWFRALDADADAENREDDEDKRYIVIGHSLRGRAIEVDTEDAALEDVREAGLDRVSGYLQAVLDHVSGLILSKYWFHLGSNSGPVDDPAILGAITDHLGPRSTRNGTKPVSRSLRYLSGWIYRVAWIKAEEINRSLAVLSAAIPPNATFCLLPPRLVDDRLMLPVVAARYNSTSGQGTFKGEWTVGRRFGRSQRIPQSSSQLYEAGLLVEPVGRTGLQGSGEEK